MYRKKYKWVLKYPLKIYDVVLPNEIVVLIIDAYLSDYRWERIMYYKLLGDKIEPDYIINNIISIKRLSKRINIIFNEWDNTNWYLRNDITLFNMSLPNMQYYFNNFVTKIYITWDLGYHHLVDYDLMTYINIYLEDTKIKLKYKCKEYSCPSLNTLSEGNFEISDGCMSNHNVTKNDINMVDKIMYVLNLPLISYNIDTIHNISKTNHCVYDIHYTVRIDNIFNKI
jgi:hypothetical protein